MKKNAGNKRLLLNAKFNNFSQRKISFLFLIFLRFYAANTKEFCSTTSYLYSKCTAKTYETKDFSLANDEETHSLNKAENEKEIFVFFYLSANKATKGKY
jgi:hypothetical protein